MLFFLIQLINKNDYIILKDMNIKYKLYTFILRALNKFVSVASKGRKKLLISDSAELSVDYKKIKNFIYRPIGINYLNKILFLDRNYGNLYNIYKLIGNKYSDHFLLKSDSDYETIKKFIIIKLLLSIQMLDF